MSVKGKCTGELKVAFHFFQMYLCTYVINGCTEHAEKHLKMCQNIVGCRLVVVIDS